MKRFGILVRSHQDELGDRDSPTASTPMPPQSLASQAVGSDSIRGCEETRSAHCSERPVDQRVPPVVVPTAPTLRGWLGTSGGRGENLPKRCIVSTSHDIPRPRNQNRMPCPAVMTPGSSMSMSSIGNPALCVSHSAINHQPFLTIITTTINYKPLLTMN